MKDLHCHLLPDIDDGSRNIEESINLLKEMETNGVKELVLTPHYIEYTKYVCNNKDKEKLLRKLKSEAKKNNINIEMYLGNEVYITDKIPELIESGEIKTINKSNYVLFELPLYQTYNNTLDMIYTMISKGYVPILAHPERYKIYQEHPEKISKLLSAGVLLQGNATSLLDKYGKKSRKTLKYFLKKKWITFLGTDTHRNVNFTEEKILRKLKRIIKDKDYIDEILNSNFDKVINNEKIGMVR